MRSLALCPVGGSLLVERTAALAAFAEAENAALASGDLDTVRLATDRSSPVSPAPAWSSGADAGHLPALEHPARFVAMVQEWVAETD
ncbi:MAG: hypothetical protein ACRCSN_02175 [Dermatophilaceae bacterium]